MAKIAYTRIKSACKIDTSVNTFDFEGSTVEVLKYLPVEDKVDLVQVALQEAEEDGVYNDIKLDVFFNLNIIYLYSNISFTDNQKSEPYKLYDQLQCAGIIDQVIANMDQDEYKHLVDYLEQTKADILTYRNTAGAVLQRVITDLPKNAQAAADIVNNISPDQFAQVRELAHVADATGMNNVIKLAAAN